jgi:MYXO-CTERM domain-containing protein
MWFFTGALAADLPVGPAQTYTSIDDALRDAVSGDRIVLDPGVWPLRETTVDIPLEITSSSGVAGTTTVEGTSGQSIFVVRAGGDLTLRAVTVDAAGRRVGIVTSASLSLVDVDVVGARAQGFGQDAGAIDATGATLTLERATVTGATAGRSGGVVKGSGTTISVVDSVFLGASADTGGVFHLSAGSSLVASGSRFEGNAAQSGAVAWVDDSTATVTSSVFVGNTGAGSVWCRASACGLSGLTFDGNTGATGAVLRLDQGADASLTDSVVCRSTGDGVVDADGATLTLSGDVFVGNDVGSGLVRADASTVDVRSVHFVGNTATGTGAALAATASAVSLLNTLVAFNAAAGPVVDVPVADLTGGYSLFFGNTTGDLPGALRATDLAVDPLFPAPAPASCDAAALAPPLASPAVNGGDPALLDPDGSRSDIGAFASPGLPVEVIDVDEDGWPVELDCDDADPTIHPQAPELACDGIDQDCDPATPDAIDGDADGISVCDGDCDDGDPDRSAYFEVYRDRDGDGVGIGEPTTLCGFPPVGASLVGGDCDDRSADRFPGNPEVPYDGVDQDCDDLDLVDVDADEVPWPDDCDDEDASVYPNAKEVEGDGIDQDCTGFDATSALVGGAGVTCGCASGPGGGGAPWLGLVGLVALRRRDGRSLAAPDLSGRSGTR